jgi:predicted Ser/Thr protein kinase
MLIRGVQRAEPDGQSLTGRLLGGKWRVGRLLGRGGTSVVYAATHRNGRQVAIKVLDPELTNNPRARARFQREGYIASRVRHDGVVAILDDDATDDGTVFMVMELLQGATLEEHRRERGGRLPVEEVLLLTDHVLDVLGAAHAGGVIHRDVKPSNVFLTTSGRLKLLDFGIASLRELSGVPNGTRSGALLGTPGFVAPEQARGRWREVDARTDLWGVGATMFRLLSGRLVHEAETANEAVIAAATLPAPGLASIDGALSAVAELVDKALRAAPGHRWQSAAEMRAAVQAMLAAFPDARLPTPRPVHEPTTLDESAPPDADGAGDAQPALESARAGARTGNRRRTLALGLVAGGAAAIAAVVFTGAGRRAPQAPAAASAAARETSVAAAPPPGRAQPPAGQPPAGTRAATPAPVATTSPARSPADTGGRQRPPRPRTRVARAGAEATTASAPEPAPPEAPTRLEDVLGERH